MIGLVSFTDFDTRIGRAKFLAGFLLLLVGATLLGVVFALLDLTDWLPKVMIFLLFIVPTLSLYVRRLHDINVSGWWAVTSFVPFVNFILFLVLCFTEGTKGANRFGPLPDPLSTQATDQQFPAAEIGEATYIINPSTEPAGLDIKVVLAANPKAQLVLDYSDKAQQQLERLSALPDAYTIRYVKHLEENPKVDPIKLTQEILAEYEAALSPFQRNEFNEAFAEARKLGEAAADEFRHVIEVLGEDADPTVVVGKLRLKFSRTAYRDYWIVPLGDGNFVVQDRTRKKAPGTKEYKSEESARHTVDFLLGG